MNEFENTGAIILAAGQGKRMQASEHNKVTYEVGGVPMITRTIQTIQDTGIRDLVVVVGFAKESVMKLLNGNIQTAEQTERLGTGHAVRVALEKVSPTLRDILVLNGDDGFWYTSQNLSDLYDLHSNTDSQMSFFTTRVQNPTGLGRIIRDDSGKVVGIVEEKNLKPEEKSISEVNLGGYIFDQQFLRKFINQIPKNEVSGEHYLTDLVNIAIQHNQRVETLKLDNFKWRGVNTPQELQEAEKLMR